MVFNAVRFLCAVWFLLRSVSSVLGFLKSFHHSILSLLRLVFLMLFAMLLLPLVVWHVVDAFGCSLVLCQLAYSFAISVHH